MRRGPTSVAAVFLCLLLLAGSSSALLTELTKEDLIVNSEAIVLGTVRTVECAWNAEHTSIYTYVTVDVSDQFKGESVGSELLIQVPGGTADGIVQKVSDTPTFVPGMNVIIHTFMKETGYPWVYGWEKGVLTVENGTIPDYMMTLDQFRQLVERTLR